MCRRPTWTLLISWMAAFTVVSLVMETKVHALIKKDEATTKGLVMNGTPVITALKSFSPALKDLVNANLHDLKDTQIRLQSVGWAGIGDIPDNLHQPSPLSLPKWVPNYKPVKEKYWNTILQALNDANRQHSKSEDNYELTTAIPAAPTSPLPKASFNEWLPTNISSLEILMHNTTLHAKPVTTTTKLMEDITERQDLHHNDPNTHMMKAFPKISHDGLLAPTFLKSHMVYLPYHVHYPSLQTNQQQENQHKRVSASRTPQTSKPRQSNYIPWPNVGKVTNLNPTSEVKSLTLLQSQKSLASTNLDENKPWQETPEVIQSSETSTQNDWTRFDRTMLHTIPMNHQYKQWPQNDKDNSSSQLQQNSSTEKFDFKRKTPSNSFLYAEFTTPDSQISNIQTGSSLENSALKFSLPMKDERNSRIKQSPKVQHDQETLNQDMLNKQETINQKALIPWEAMVTSKNQEFREKQEVKVYTQPWLHAIVQNDLKNWGFPYDEEALQDLPPGYHHSAKPSSRGQHKNVDLSINSSDKVNSQNHNHMSLSSTRNAQHLAIAEALHKPSNMPLHIKNYHVTRPIPNNMPPMFQAAETKQIEFPPYMVNGASSTLYQNCNNPRLVIPHSAQELHPQEHSSNLKQASQRQDISSIQMMMQPIRDILHIRNHPNNPHAKKPLPSRHTAQRQYFAPLKLTLPPPEATKEGKSLSEISTDNEHPGFGPPKGEDIVIMPNNSEHQRGEEDLKNQEPLEILLEPVIFHDTQYPFPSQQLHHQNIPKQSVSSGEPQTHSVISSMPQNHPDNIGQPQDQETITVSPHTQKDVFQQSPQNPSSNFQTSMQVQKFQQGNTQSSTDTLEEFHPNQVSKEEVLPPVVNTDTFTQPTDQQDPIFISWPNTQNTNTAAPSTNISPPQAEVPSEQSTSFFNQPFNILPFQLPSMPSMSFLNPFNLFRRPEIKKRKKSFPFPPSRFPKADNEPSAPMTTTNSEDPLSLNNPQPLKSASKVEFNNNSNISFLIDISRPRFQPPSSIHSIDYNRFEIQHLANKQLKSAIPQINQDYTNIQPLVNQYTKDQTHNTQYTQLTDISPMNQYNSQKKTDSFQASTVQNNAPKNLRNIYLHNSQHVSKAFTHPSYLATPKTRVAIVTPQINPAHPASSEPHIKMEDNLGPDLIKFTIDDVIHVPNSHIYTDQISKTEHNTEGRTESKDHIGEKEMDLSSSEKIVKAAEFVPQPQSSVPNIFMMQTNKPNPTTATITLPTKITKLPYVLQKASSMKPQIKFIPWMQPVNQPHNQLNISTPAPPNFLHKTQPSNFAMNSPTTYKPFTNNTMNATNIPMVWEITQPPNVQFNNTLVDNKQMTRSSHLPSPTSTKVTIIEATPMPDFGEIFPKLKRFRTFTTRLPPLTTINPTIVTTTIPAITTTVTPKANRLDAYSVKQIQTIPQTPKMRTATRLLPPNLMNIRKRPEIMMPGNWNHRTISKPPQIESDSFITHVNKTNGREHIMTHNQHKIRYITHSRKVHMNRPKPQPDPFNEKTPNISATEPITMYNASLHSSPTTFQTPSQINITFEIPTTTSQTSQEIQTVVFTRHPTAKMQSKIQERGRDDHGSNGDEETEKETTSSTPETDGPFPVGKVTRYASIQRLRNFMANKRRNRTHTTPKATVLLTKSRPSVLVQTKTLKTNNPIFAETSTPPSIRIDFKRTHHPNRKITPLTTTPITPTTTMQSIKYLNFMGNDQEKDHSGSSIYEWHQPIQKALQDHPEMIEFYNWESSRLGAGKNHNNTNYPTEDQDYNHKDSSVLLHKVLNLPPMTVQPFRQATRVPASHKSSHLQVSASSPEVL